MKATDKLKEEHEAIRLMLKILQKVCEKLEAGEKVSAAHLDDILEFIRDFADKCHHGKEEDILFPAMEDAGIPREGGPVGVMLMEHDMGRNYVKGLREGIDDYKRGFPDAPVQISENARNYVALLNSHIEKENNILFQIADMHLAEAKQKELLEKFNEVENEHIGHGKHEELLRILNALKITYLELPVTSNT